MSMKRIGILTSGGDCPGMNATINAVVRCAVQNGLETVGIIRGYSGLINDNVKPLKLRDVQNIVSRGGTILHSARCLDMKTKTGVQKAVQTCKKHGIDGLVVIGGDGSFCGAQVLSNEGILCIGLPGTIDNDIAYTEYTLGYDTAVNTAIEMVDKLNDTITSHDRCSVVEVMGRDAGYIALDVALSCSASFVIVPEEKFNKQNLINKIQTDLANGKKHFIVVVAECILNVHDLAKEIEEKTGVESRATVLGHVQRGGSPSAKDRLVGAILGFRAVELLVSGVSNRVVGLQNGKVIDCEINEALKMKKSFPKNLYDMVGLLF